jgi:hypothetical protein
MGLIVGSQSAHHLRASEHSLVWSSTMELSLSLLSDIEPHFAKLDNAPGPCLRTINGANMSGTSVDAL